MGEVEQLMDAIVYTIDQPSVWMTAVINLMELFVLVGLGLLLYMLYRHLRNRNADEKPKNQEETS